MESVAACCSQCDHYLALLLNIWTQIGKSYISPVIQGQDEFDIRPEGAIRPGENGTIVSNCHVQEIVCNKCRSTLGSKCVSSAVNHVLHEGQLLLRASSIQIKDPDNNALKKPFIQRVLKLKTPPVNRAHDRSQSAGIAEDYSQEQTDRGHPQMRHILENVHAQGEEIERLDKFGYQVVASFNETVQRIDEDVRRLKREMEQLTGGLSNNSKTKALSDDLSSMKTEIRNVKKLLQLSVTRDRMEQETSSIRTTITQTNDSVHLELTGILKEHQERVNLLESNLDSTRHDVEELKTLLEDSWATGKAVQSAAEEIASLKTELKQVKEELALEKSHRLSTVTPAFDPQDVDILTASITKIGQRASQVELLRMEFDLLKSRVQRMEAHALTSKTDVTTDHQTKG